MSAQTALVVGVRALRKSHGLTVEDLLERIAEQGVVVADSTIYCVEGGHRKPSDKLRVAWARALRMHPLDLWVVELADADSNDGRAA